MLNKKEYNQNQRILYTMEDLVPENSLFRKIDKCIENTDFFIFLC